MKKGALGRGLGALLTDSGKQEEGNPQETLVKASISEINIHAIEVNPFQPRTDFDEEALQELAESIKTQGIIQPITVRKLSENSYQLISGERRLQASKRIGLATIPAYIRTANDQQMLEMALIENIQRENLNPIEIALSYQRLITECNLKQEELGDRVSKNRSTVTNYLRLLKLPPMVQASLRDKQITMGHARAIINVDNTEDQISILKKILLLDLSVRSVEDLVRTLATPASKPPIKKPEGNHQIRQVQTKLASHFGTKVVISANNKNKGEIKIPFGSTEDLNRILDILDA